MVSFPSRLDIAAKSAHICARENGKALLVREKDIKILLHRWIGVLWQLILLQRQPNLPSLSDHG